MKLLGLNHSQPGPPMLVPPNCKLGGTKPLLVLRTSVVRQFKQSCQCRECSVRSRYVHVQFLVILLQHLCLMWLLSSFRHSCGIYMLHLNDTQQVSSLLSC